MRYKRTFGFLHFKSNNYQLTNSRRSFSSWALHLNCGSARLVYPQSIFEHLSPDFGIQDCLSTESSLCSAQLMSPGPSLTALIMMSIKNKRHCRFKLMFCPFLVFSIWSSHRWSSSQLLWLVDQILSHLETCYCFAFSAALWTSICLLNSCNDPRIGTFRAA